MTIGIERVTIIGVGLLGASLGLALKERRLAAHVAGVGRRRESLETALNRGAIDSAGLDVREGVARADWVVIATPAALVIPTLDAVLEAAPPNAIVFDVASVKKAICAHAHACCPTPRRFVGCHPMAGSEKFGPEHASAALFENTTCLVEQDPALDDTAREEVCALWRAVGAQVADMNAETHDAMLARTSHAPHVLAAALAQMAANYGATRAFVGNGLLDVTRIAASRPEIWRDICLANSTALLETLSHLRALLNEFETSLAAGNAVALEAFFHAGAQGRERITQP